MIEELKQKMIKAQDELNALCHGKKFTMRVPVRPDEDSDLVIAEGLCAGLTALGELERIQQALSPEAQSQQLSRGAEMIATERRRQID
jgi:hypothetical protein